MQENYLAKWLNNELSEEELAEFEQSEAYATYAKIREFSNEMETPDFDVEKAFMTLKDNRIQTEGAVIQLHPFKKFLRVAAVILVLLTGSYFYLNTLDTEIGTAYAETEVLTLPDNSEVVLNADSQISYDTDNWDEERALTLKGEAFFKVAKGRRFVVTTDAGKVSVLGTQFNVIQREGMFNVSCYEGLVSVRFKGKETKLPAGSSLMAIDGKLVAPTTVPRNGTPSWLDKESTFKSVPLGYVLKEFERQHNIEVATENVDLERLYTGTFSNTNAELAMKSISVPSRIKFKFEGNKVLFYAQNTP